MSRSSFTRSSWRPVFPEVRHPSLVQSYSAVPPWTRGGEMMKNLSAKNLGAPRRRPLQPGHQAVLPAVLQPTPDHKYSEPPPPYYYSYSREMLQHPYAARARSKTGVRNAFTSTLSLAAVERSERRWVPAREVGRKSSFCWSNLEVKDRVDELGNTASSVLILGRRPLSPAFTSTSQSSFARSQSAQSIRSRSSVQSMRSRS